MLLTPPTGFCLHYSISNEVFVAAIGDQHLPACCSADIYWFDLFWRLPSCVLLVVLGPVVVIETDRFSNATVVSLSKLPLPLLPLILLLLLLLLLLLGTHRMHLPTFPDTARWGRAAGFAW